jgi:hypothetical protein
MNPYIELKSSLPKITSMNLKSLNKPIALIAAAGFEDRAVALLEKMYKDGLKVEYVIGIKYRPYNRKNKVAYFYNQASKVLSISKRFKWMVYDRYNPAEFMSEFNNLHSILTDMSTIIVDVSGMSKFLIAVLLQCLRDINTVVVISYAEASVYHPTLELFNKSKIVPAEVTPEFLTTDIFKIVTTTSLSSPSMQGYPSLMIAFPTFNNRELIALINEITPQYLILLYGKPHSMHDQWRLEAIKWLNNRIKEHILVSKTVSTFDYGETIVGLEMLYQEYQYTHKILIAPTGSKLQTLGVFLFRQMHPDVQLVYPVTRQFATEYTEGCKAVWSVVLPSIPNLIGQLNKFNCRDLIKLRDLIATKSKG